MGSAAGPPQQVSSAAQNPAQEEEEAHEDDASFRDVVDAVNELIKADRRLHADVRSVLKRSEQQEKTATEKKRRGAGGHSTPKSAGLRAGTRSAKK